MRTLSKKVDEATATLIRNCKKVIERIAPGSQVILYGSRARGDASPESDYDIMVVIPDYCDNSVIDNVHDKLYDIELEEQIVINVIVKKKSIWQSDLYKISPLKNSIEKEGVLA